MTDGEEEKVKVFYGSTAASVKPPINQFIHSFGLGVRVGMKKSCTLFPYLQQSLHADYPLVSATAPLYPRINGNKIQ